MLFDYKKAMHIGYLFVVLCAAPSWAGKIHDPTQPKVGRGVQGVLAENSVGTGLNLQGIVRNKKNKVAIISGKLVNKGDLIDGFKLIKIDSDHVVLVNAGTQKRLYVYE